VRERTHWPVRWHVDVVRHAATIVLVREESAHPLDLATLDDVLPPADAAERGGARNPRDRFGQRELLVT
jgi:hypothetical protein